MVPAAAVAVVKDLFPAVAAEDLFQTASLVPAVDFFLGLLPVANSFTATDLLLTID